MNNTRTATAARQGRAAANGGGNSQSARPDIRKAMKKLESTGPHAEKAARKGSFFLAAAIRGGSASQADRRHRNGGKFVDNFCTSFLSFFK